MGKHNIEDRVIVNQAKKSLLYNNSERWMKKDGRPFDVTMGAFKGKEVRELIGTFILYKLSKIYQKLRWSLSR